MKVIFKIIWEGIIIFLVGNDFLFLNIEIFEKFKFIGWIFLDVKGFVYIGILCIGNIWEFGLFE